MEPVAWGGRRLDRGTPRGLGLTLTASAAVLAALAFAALAFAAPAFAGLAWDVAGHHGPVTRSVPCSSRLS